MRHCQLLQGKRPIRAMAGKTYSVPAGIGLKGIPAVEAACAMAGRYVRGSSANIKRPCIMSRPYLSVIDKSSNLPSRLSSVFPGRLSVPIRSRPTSMAICVESNSRTRYSRAMFS